MKVNERLARVIARLCDEREEKWQDWLIWANFMLEEISVPDEGMLIAARDWSMSKYGHGIGDDAAKGCWMAMVLGARDAQ